MSIHPTIKIDASATVDSSATIDAGSRNWYWVHVCAGAVIGERCSLGQNVFVSSQMRVGNQDSVKLVGCR